MANFTPSPWSVEGFVVLGNRKVRDLAQQGYPIRNESICRVTPKNDEEEDRANAHLIAAAPDLYRELAHLVRLLEPLEREGSLNVPGWGTLNAAREALKKAKEQMP